MVVCIRDIQTKRALWIAFWAAIAILAFLMWHGET